MQSPTLDEFLKLAAQGNLIPIMRRSSEGKGGTLKTNEPQLLTTE
jgi:hypothetical protein